MGKRILSMLLCLALTAGLFLLPAQAEHSRLSPSCAILENILNGDRHFVLDTLIDGSFATNPHALVNFIDGDKPMMLNVLSKYEDKNDPNYSAVYKATVDVMEKIYNFDEYAATAADFVTEYEADLYGLFSVDAKNLVSDLTYSKSQLNYESILKEALAADYTASDGTKLSTKEIELKNLERLEKGLKNLKSFSDFFKADASANHMGDDTFNSRMQYYNNYLVPYADSMAEALDAFSELQQTSGKSEQQQMEDMISFTVFLATLSQMDRYESASDDLNSDIVYYAPTFFISDEALGVIKSGGKAISTVTKTLSSYMFIESIATQSDAMKGALTRMSATADSQMKPVLQKFAAEIGAAGNAKLIGYESLMQYLRNAGVVREILTTEIKSIMKSCIEEWLGFSEVGLETTAVGGALASAASVVGIASWCADLTTSFGDTCKKTYELKYLRKLLNRAISTYRSDLAAYQSNKTEANAKAVLDDLLLIQKLRLRGETIAYKMTQGQWNSPLGRLLATGTLNTNEMLMSYLDEAYQARVDAFVGASPSPLSTTSLTIGNGETLSIGYNAAKGGLYGSFKKSNGDSYGIGELQYRIANGVTVASGGRLIAASETAAAYISYIENKGGEIRLAAGSRVDELTQSSGATTYGGAYNGTTVTLNGGTMTASHGGALNCEELTVSGATLSGCSGITTKTLETSGTVTLPAVTVENLFNQTGGTLTIDGDVTANGDASFGGVFTQNGAFRLAGDLMGSGSGAVTLGNLTFCGKLPQKVDRAVTCRNFTNSNARRLTLNAEVTVTGAARSPAEAINGENVVVTGSGYFPDTTYSGNVMLRDFSGEIPQTVKGTVHTSGDVTLSRGAAMEGLQVKSGTLSLSGGAYTLENVLSVSSGATLSVQKDSALTASMIAVSGTLAGEGAYLLKGDLYNSGTVNVGTLECSPLLPVSLNGNAITVGVFRVTGSKAVTLNTTVNVTKDYILQNSKVVNPENVAPSFAVSLQETTEFKSPITFNDCLVVDGITVYARKGVTLNGGLIVKNGGRLIADGMTTITGGSEDAVWIDETSVAELRRLTVIKSVGAITADGLLYIGGDAVLTSTKLTGSGTVAVCGDLLGSSLTVDRPGCVRFCGKLPQTVSASGAKFHNLRIENPSRGGVSFSGAVSYNGAYSPGSGKVSGTVTEG